MTSKGCWKARNSEHSRSPGIAINKGEISNPSAWLCPRGWGGWGEMRDSAAGNTNAEPPAKRGPNALLRPSFWSRTREPLRKEAAAWVPWIWILFSRWGRWSPQPLDRLPQTQGALCSAPHICTSPAAPPRSSTWVFPFRCSPKDGQCECRPHVTGRSCNQPALGYFFAPLNFYLYEAEEATPLQGLSPLVSISLTLPTDFSQWRVNKYIQHTLEIMVIGLRKECFCQQMQTEVVLYHTIADFINFESKVCAIYLCHPILAEPGA